MGRFINSDTAVCTGQGFSGNNAFVYCGNNPIVRSDDGGNAWETVWDILSLGSSILDVAMNPADPWAWIGLAGDLIDVAVPFVGGLGEATRAANAALNVSQALDDAHDASKVIDDIAEATVKCDALCFVAGTEVLVQDGVKNIECIQVGDQVWAWDEATDTVALKDVVETYINETNELIHVFVCGQEIITTPSHPFYSPDKGWTDAVNLRAGDMLVLLNGEFVVVENVQYEILETPITVYNFQVADYHTYYVADGVLVHNACSVKRGPKPKGTGAHNSKIVEIADDIEANNIGTVIAGGRKPEILIPTPGGYKSGRRPDILVKRSDGSYFGINVGKTAASGAPITREVQALYDLEDAGLPMFFVGYK